MLIIEDGTGLVDADAYISVEYADQYHQKRLHTDWTGTPGEKEAAIIKATQYIDNKYQLKWIGEVAFEHQALCWPRLISGAITLPEKLKKAVCEAALRFIRGEDLSPDLERGGKVKQEVVGPITTVYEDKAPVQTKITGIADLLKGLINRQTGNIRIIR